MDLRSSASDNPVQFDWVLALPRPAPGEAPPIQTQTFLAEARRLVEEASRQGLILRVLGGVGIRLQCQGHDDLARRLNRTAESAAPGQEFVDLDFAAYRRQRPRLPAFFADMGYVKRKTTMATAISERHIYFHRAGWFQVDVFFDKMLMEHDLDLRGRLEMNAPALTPTDLLLSKLLVTHFTLKDLKDTWLLLYAHAFAPGAQAIQPDYIASVVSRDWGFWYDVVTNLSRLRSLTPESSLLLETEKRDIMDKVEAIARAIVQRPKSLAWRLRSLIGRRRQWYRPVEE